MDDLTNPEHAERLALTHDQFTIADNGVDGEAYPMRMATHEKTAATLRALSAALEQARAALGLCLSNMTAPHASFETGCCMCGTDMDAGVWAHGGHTPTDSGLYNADQAIEDARRVLSMLDMGDG
ncbi:hypothetical protein PVV74_11550 [Roseovarius sp. SK2]|uniref:hypothetical protein n=1 Tax=Roseovarius TaxID=74030 RepID=UPI00237B2966|nr:hypothetical protein [Roseovarius sp. SK2]MDD9726091.1 hypothetical protein [Roseovarius sp. SK2]